MNATILYDDINLATKTHAMLMKAARHANDLFWSIKSWSIEMLLDEPNSDAVLDGALEAHLIVLAMRHPAQCSPWLMDWLEKWAQARQVDETALAMFDGQNDDALSVTPVPVLAQFARRHGLSFILDDLPMADEGPTTLTHRLQERAVAITPTLHHIMDQTAYDQYRNWGINE